MTCTVAILGRPNVGKSTLFNRLAGKRLALVHDTPGVTRDWKVTPVKLGNVKFDLIDTAGLDEDGDQSLTTRMKKSTEAVLKEKADIAIFVIDARVGVTPQDEEIASWIRPFQVPVILVANKCEGRGGEAGYYEAFKLGLGEPVAFSAEHGEGLGELIQNLAALIPESEAGENEEFEDGQVTGPIKLAIVGRPNAGKSTLINRLMGENRVLTGPEAGITRDSIALDWSWGGRDVQLFDTAGLRKKARVQEKLEKMSVGDTLNAIDFAHVVVLICEPEVPISHQDIKIATQVLAEGRALILAFNKVDTIKDITAFRNTVRASVEDQFPHAKGLHVAYLSALKGVGVKNLMPAVFKVYDTWNHRVPTALLNRWLAGVLERHPLPLVKRRTLKIRYVAQIKTRPPTFALYANRPVDIPTSYLRYLENDLRKTFKLPGIPLRLQVKGGENPYHQKQKR